MKTKLRERIRELASIGVSERIRRRNLSGKERYQARLEYLYTTRFEARHTLLAYAFLRGAPYRSVERKVLEKPSYYKIAGILDVDPQVIQSWLMSKEAGHQHNLNEMEVC